MLTGSMAERRKKERATQTPIDTNSSRKSEERISRLAHQ